MKKNKWKKLLVFVLAFSMCVTTAVPSYAATGSRSFASSWTSFWEKIFSSGNRKNETTESEDTSAAEETTEAGGSLDLIEDETTIEGDVELRASTYALSNDSANAQADGTNTLKYFPVTMYNYDADTINNATHQVEVDGGLGDTWNGIYFSDGSPAAESYSEDIALENGTYIIQNARAYANNVGSWLVGSTSGITSTANQSDATQWTVTSNGDGTYTLTSTSGYMTIGSGEHGDKTADAVSNIEIVGYTGNSYTGCVQLKSDFYYLCQWGRATATEYGGYNVNNDGGNAFYFYKVTDSTPEQVTFTTTDSLPYATWNWWNKRETGRNKNNYGQYTYSGLVESTLTANKDITFTKPDGGIFNSDTSVKDIYTGVEMPFVYENGIYTFDASQNGVYFYGDSTQGSTAAQSNGRLYFNEGRPQSNGGKYGDGSTTVWMPFNSTQSINGEGNCDYHFGMRTTIPFTMTANGKMNPNDDTSEDITFSFSGDDDVWIFIDGKLVIDLGGIHNRLDARINFAKNTWAITADNGATTTDDDGNKIAVAVKDCNDAALSGTIFNDGDTTGTLNQTRETFAATDSHELTIFYLERGAGSSNCKIKFNLPMKDTLTVKKTVSEKDSEGVALSEDTLAQINNRDFKFKLYKNGTVEKNTKYNLLNENGQFLQTASTDDEGIFSIKNNQTAKFVGVIGSSFSYYVEEIKDGTGWEEPEYTCNYDVTNGATETASSTAGESMTVTATGSDEAEDKISFVCKNTFTHVDGTSLEANDDTIVIDYGLPVEIDVLKNDIVTGGSKELIDNSIKVLSGSDYGTASIENGVIKYQLTKPLTNVVVLEYGVEAVSNQTVGDNKTGKAKVYIIPATSMYYEEDFSDLVTFSNGWSDVGTAQTDPQEPGVVGTVGDSPYGSDAAYLNDSGDSNGSSKYVDTTNGAATFSYTFTGTGTSFFARTTNNSGYMRVRIKKENETVYTGYRDTSYKTKDNDTTLYNVPVFTWDYQDYGTYTVEVTLAKKTGNFGYKFWLDGIRVISPLDNQDTNIALAKQAYATDGEADMVVVTLREKLLGEANINEDGSLNWDSDNFVVFTDTNGAITSAEEYNSNGPKEEVYLNEGQSITFSLTDWDTNSNKIYLGLKAPFGSGSVSINNNSKGLQNTVDCYYDISSYAKITTDSNGMKIATFEIKATSSLVSVTNIKVTGDPEFIIINQEDTDGDSSGDNDNIEVNGDDEESSEDSSETTQQTEQITSSDPQDDLVPEEKTVKKITSESTEATTSTENTQTTTSESADTTTSTENTEETSTESSTSELQPNEEGVGDNSSEEEQEAN